jgi:hypothetical protein
MAVSGGAAVAADSSTSGTVAGVLGASGITASGYVAASYNYSNGYNTYHVFDQQHDSFQLDQAALTVAYQPKDGFGALVDIAAGEDMKVLNAAEGNSSSSFDIVQGFVQYAGGPLTVIAGKFATLGGAETIAVTGNTNYSRSFLFYAEPLSHTGIRATFAATDSLNLVAGVNNGWNYTSLSSSSAKTGELGVAWSLNKLFSLSAYAYVGRDPAFDAQRSLVKALATYNATDALSFVLSYDWGKQQQHAADAPDFDWNGLAAYVNYAFNQEWRVSLRAEYLDDKDGLLTNTVQKLKEGTLTVGFAPVKSFELRLEGRYDKSDKATFVRSINEENASPFADSQTGFALQGVYKF